MRGALTGIVPEVTELTRPFWSGLEAGELRIQWCRACQARWHPPQPVCPTCQSRDIGWRGAAGNGVIHSYTVVHHAAHAVVKDAIPYTVVVVELDEGPRVIGNLSGVATKAEVGARVRFVSPEVSSGGALTVAFALCDD